jgi:serine/threonine protein kinase
MGTSTQLDALGDTLTVPAIAGPPPAEACPSEPISDGGSLDSGSAPTVLSDSDTRDRTLAADESERANPPAAASSTPSSGECLSDDAILQYRQGEMTAAQLECTDRHLDRCAKCRELVELVIADDSDAFASSPHVTTFQRGFVAAGRYQIEQFVGRGGMGEVYAATDQMTGRRVALKTVLCTATDDARAIRKLLDEVVNAQRVAHPHVFKIYDLHEHRDDLRGRVPFFTMEFIDGQSLRARLRREQVIPIAEAQTIARQLLSGLSAAHSKGVLHLDFKVDNVMLRQLSGEAVIMDFGLSRASDVQSRLHTSERLQGAGTLPYMSLEQLECRADLGPASDVYSFGVVLYEMLTGRLPFQAHTFRAILLEQLRGRPAPLSQYVPVSAQLEAFVLKCLARAPGDRYADAAQALAALESVTSWAKPAPSAPRSRARWLALGLLLCSVFAALVAARRTASPSEVRPPVLEARLQQELGRASPAPPDSVPEAPQPPPAEVAPSPPESSATARTSAKASPGARRRPATSAAGATPPQASPAAPPEPPPVVPSDWTGPPPQRVPRPRPL